ncbi:MAG: aminoacyl-tRNA hydrolase [Gammaproteobacteria bacterium]|nr:aminoacyl-tRNA hydrolase [Gammaproteobacteria bacterium]
MPIKLIVGLRNPGSKYAKTRHNVGEWMLHAAAPATWLNKKDFFGEVAELEISGQKVWGLLPNTFMNLSGQAVAAISRFYRFTPQEILVIHDDLDLPVGSVRLKQGGGHGGHNGLQDIIRHLGADFYRIRIGIGHPGDKSQVANYVLHEPSVVEKKDLDFAIAHTIPYFADIIAGNMSAVMNELHRR